MKRFFLRLSSSWLCSGWPPAGCRQSLRLTMSIWPASEKFRCSSAAASSRSTRLRAIRCSSFTANRPCGSPMETNRRHAMAHRCSLQRARGRRISGLRHPECRSARSLRLGTERSQIFQFRRALALFETDRRAGRTIGQAPVGAALGLPERDLQFAQCAGPLSALEE